MIETTQHGDVAVVTLAHGKANLFDLEFCGAVTSAFEACARSSAKAVVVTARGSIFSGGVDLRRLLDGGKSYVEAFMPALGRAFETAFTCPKPVVAAVNGHAIAGGCILACAADRRLMARGTGRIGVPELLVGVPFPTIAIEIVRQVVPQPHLTALVTSGETVDADGARARGLVDAVADPDRLLDEALAAANAMAALPPAAFAIFKQQQHDSALARIRDGRERFDPLIHQYWANPDTFDRIRAYVARTLKK